MAHVQRGMGGSGGGIKRVSEARRRHIGRGERMGGVEREERFFCTRYVVALGRDWTLGL